MCVFDKANLSDWCGIPERPRKVSTSSFLDLVLQSLQSQMKNCAKYLNVIKISYKFSEFSGWALAF